MLTICALSMLMSFVIVFVIMNPEYICVFTTPQLCVYCMHIDTFDNSMLMKETWIIFDCQRHLYFKWRASFIFCLIRNLIKYRNSVRKYNSLVGKQQRNPNIHHRSMQLNGREIQWKLNRNLYVFAYTLGLVQDHCVNKFPMKLNNNNKPKGWHTTVHICRQFPLIFKRFRTLHSSFAFGLDWRLY